LLGEEKTTARVVAEFNVDGRMRALDATIHVAGTPLIQYLFDHKEPLVVTDFQRDPRLASLRGLTRQRGIFSLLLPLVVKGEVVGGLGLVKRGQLKLSPLVTHSLPFSRYVEGVELLWAKRAVKICFLPWAED